MKTVDEVICSQFDVMEYTDLSQALLEEERLGYQSVHYLVRLRPERAALPEYAPFRGLIAEIQVRTVLQHAWAEIEHDIEYKSAVTIPKEIRRRFMVLAGMLELADREFQAIQDADADLRKQALSSVARGELQSVEITADTLRAYLNKKLGTDDRISTWSYDWEARLLKRLGFSTFSQVDECIAGYDDDRVSRLVSGSRQGQISRFEYLLLAGMGERFIELHPSSRDYFWADFRRGLLERMRTSGTQIKDYRPNPGDQRDSVVP